MHFLTLIHVFGKFRQIFLWFENLLQFYFISNLILPYLISLKLFHFMLIINSFNHKPTPTNQIARDIYNLRALKEAPATIAIVDTPTMATTKPK